jgi:hypothetical protein
MDVPDDDWAAYLNRRTGELVTITGEEARLVDDADADDDGVVELEDERLHLIRVARGSSDRVRDGIGFRRRGPALNPTCSR